MVNIIEFDDFEYIEYVNQNSLFENTLHFISEDDEYFVLDLEQQENIFHEEIYFENKLFIGYLDEQYMLGYMPSGEIYVYKKNVSDIALLWSHNYNYDINLLTPDACEILKKFNELLSEVNKGNINNQIDYNDYNRLNDLLNVQLENWEKTQNKINKIAKKNHSNG